MPSVVIWNVPKCMLQSQRAGVEARKALEVSGAYAAKGRVLTKPDYLDCCAAFATPDEFVVCALQNPHNTCGAWAADAEGEKKVAAGVIAT